MKKRFGRWKGSLGGLALAVAAAVPAVAQDGNVTLPVEEIEARLSGGTFDIVDMRPSRGLESERTYRTALSFDDGEMMVVKWAPSAVNGEAFNNQPRYELAAYAFQKLFLDPADYVVPPTVVRAFSVAWYRSEVGPLHEAGSRQGGTFREAESVVVTLQYWLFNVTGDGVWDEDRFEADSVYARHFADLNLLTYLIRHNDANQGNLLISRAPDNPRVFAVDNGLAFGSVTSDRGATWRQMQVRKLPAATVARLRSITEEDLRRTLETVAQFEVGEDGLMRPVPPTENLSPGRGVRRSDGVIQLGLTEREIRELWRRLEDLIEDVDEGRYTLF